MNKQITKEEIVEEFERQFLTHRIQKVKCVNTNGEVIKEWIWGWVKKPSPESVITEAKKLLQEALSSLETAVIERCIEALPKKQYRDKGDVFYVQSIGWNLYQEKAEEDLRALLEPKKEI
jgi:hypothetical protein